MTLTKRTQRILSAVKRFASSLSNSALLLHMQVATMLRNRKPTRKDRYLGEILEGLSGPESMARRKRSVRSLASGSQGLRLGEDTLAFPD